jgi:hypothetical protein
VEPRPRDRGRELYNVASNPTEEGNNIIEQEPELAVALEKQILAYLGSVDAEKPKVNRKNKKKQKGKQKGK